MKITTIANLSLGALLMGASMLAATAAGAAELAVKAPWVALAPPGAQATAAFMELHNPGQQPIEVVGANAEGFEAVELHRSINDNGMHRMVKQDRITVPAGGSVTLAPGGYHVMLIGPARALEEGEVLTVELRLDGGEVVPVEAPVKRREQVTGGQGHKH